MAEDQRRVRFEQALTGAVWDAAWRYACRLCTVAGVLRYHEAEDLLQESLIQAYARFEQLRELACFKAWLLRIMHSCFITRYRRELRRRAVEERATAPDEPHPDDPLAEQVRGALCRLPAAQRELLHLFYREDLSLQETALVLGVPARVLRQRLLRAREALRRQLNPVTAPMTGRTGWWLVPPGE